MLTRAEILRQIKKPKVMRIDTPEWADKEYVYVRMFSAGELADLQAFGEQNGKMPDETKALVGMCILGICNERGVRLFNKDDAPALLEGPLAPLQRCAMAIIELNGLDEESTRLRKKK